MSDTAKEIINIHARHLKSIVGLALSIEECTSVFNQFAFDYKELFKEKPKQTIEERNSIFFDSVHSAIMRDNMDIPKNQIQDFIDYWTEISPNAKKMRFEKEKVFDIKKRLERWNKNQKTFNNGKPTTTTDDAIRSFITE